MRQGLVWQVRENMRNAVRQQPKKFSTEKEALDYLETKLGVRLSDYRKASVILNRKNLFDFVKTNV